MPVACSRRATARRTAVSKPGGCAADAQVLSPAPFLPVWKSSIKNYMSPWPGLKTRARVTLAGAAKPRSGEVYSGARTTPVFPPPPRQSLAFRNGERHLSGQAGPIFGHRLRSGTEKAHEGTLRAREDGGSGHCGERLPPAARGKCQVGEVRRLSPFQGAASCKARNRLSPFLNARRCEKPPETGGFRPVLRS